MRNMGVQKNALSPAPSQKKTENKPTRTTNTAHTVRARARRHAIHKRINQPYRGHGEGYTHKKNRQKKKSTDRNTQAARDCKQARKRGEKKANNRTSWAKTDRIRRTMAPWGSILNASAPT